MPLSAATKPVRSVGGFLSGFQYPIRALFFILAHPSLWPFCIIPFIINAVVLCLLWYYLGEWSHHFVAAHLTGTAWYWDAARAVAGFLALVIRVLATMVGFVVVGTFAALPFNDFLSERTDKLASGWVDPRPFSIWRITTELAVVGTQEASRMSIYLVIIALLFALSFVPIIAPITMTLKLLTTAMFFATDYLSYPLERRGALLFKDKMRFARKVTPISLGFGCAITIIFLIPFVNFVFFPLAVVGGTLLFADLIESEPWRLAEGMPETFQKHLLKKNETAIQPTSRPAPKTLLPKVVDSLPLTGKARRGPESRP